MPAIHAATADPPDRTRTTAGDSCSEVGNAASATTSSAPHEARAPDDKRGASDTVPLDTDDVVTTSNGTAVTRAKEPRNLANGRRPDIQPVG
jgi:hypothetical protein